MALTFVLLSHQVAPALARSVNIWAAEASANQIDHANIRQQNPGPPPPIENVSLVDLVGHCVVC